jgi:hypothetical protein
MSPDTRILKMESLYKNVQKYENMHRKLEKEINSEDQALRQAAQIATGGTGTSMYDPEQKGAMLQ